MRGRIALVAGAAALALASTLTPTAVEAATCTTTVTPLNTTGLSTTSLITLSGVSGEHVIGMYQQGQALIYWATPTSVPQVYPNLNAPRDVNDLGTVVGGNNGGWVKRGSGVRTPLTANPVPSDGAYDVAPDDTVGGANRWGAILMWGSPYNTLKRLPPTGSSQSMVSVRYANPTVATTGDAIGYAGGSLIRWHNFKVNALVRIPAGFGFASADHDGFGYRGQIAGDVNYVPAIFSIDNGLVMYPIPGLTRARMSAVSGVYKAGIGKTGAPWRVFAIDGDGVVHWPTGASHIGGLDGRGDGIIVGTTASHQPMMWSCIAGMPTTP